MYIKATRHLSSGEYVSLWVGEHDVYSVLMKYKLGRWVTAPEHNKAGGFNYYGLYTYKVPSTLSLRKVKMIVRSNINPSFSGDIVVFRCKPKYQKSTNGIYLDKCSIVTFNRLKPEEILFTIKCKNGVLEK